VGGGEEKALREANQGIYIYTIPDTELADGTVCTRYVGRGMGVAPADDDALQMPIRAK
jgi:hypothetical protein